MQGNPQRRTGGQKRKSNFDVSMGTYDGAEVCELIGIFMLSLLSKYIARTILDCIEMTTLLF